MWNLFDRRKHFNKAGLTCKEIANPSELSSKNAHTAFTVEQRSPNFLAPGTSFVEDNVSTDGGRGAGGVMVQVVMHAMGSIGSGRWSFPH